MPRNVRTRTRSLVALGAETVDIALDGEGVERGTDGLPTAVRLFRAGPNETHKGTFVFDKEAADSVMAAANSWGVDMMFDLQHLSIDEEAPNYDPDARGWFRLEVRNGELWAVGITWTADGARRLTEKTQRYISPAFARDGNRVTQILNVALVAMPATHGTPALVAAGRSTKPMKLKDQILARLSIANGKIVKLAEEGAEESAPPGKFAAVKDAAAKVAEMAGALEGITDVDEAMNAAAAALDACKALEAAISALTGGAAEPAPAPEAAAVDPAKPEDEQKLSRTERAELLSLRAAKAKREEDEQVAKLAAEMKERGDLEAELVKLGRETPASVKLLSTLSLGDLRKRVEMFRGAPVALGGPRPPAGSSTGGAGSKDFVTSSGAVVTLTANQLRECEINKAKPEALAELLATRTPAKR